MNTGQGTCCGSSKVIPVSGKTGSGICGACCGKKKIKVAGHGTRQCPKCGGTGKTGMRTK